MNSCKRCSSYAINPQCHDRVPGVDLDLCDVCYWRACYDEANAACVEKQTIIDRFMESEKAFIYRLDAMTDDGMRCPDDIHNLAYDAAWRLGISMSDQHIEHVGPGALWQVIRAALESAGEVSGER